jgi:hypothetical protein
MRRYTQEQVEATPATAEDDLTWPDRERLVIRMVDAPGQACLNAS